MKYILLVRPFLDLREEVLHPTSGGVVTFTPSALFEDPVGACQLMAQIAEHPLWTCYLLPSVVGMLAQLTCRKRDPLAVFDQCVFNDLKHGFST
jgi:hypothetical protein